MLKEKKNLYDDFIKKANYYNEYSLPKKRNCKKVSRYSGLEDAESQNH